MARGSRWSKVTVHVVAAKACWRTASRRPHCGDGVATTGTQRPTPREKALPRHSATGDAFVGELLPSNRLQAGATLKVGKSRLVRATHRAPGGPSLTIILPYNRLQDPLRLTAGSGPNRPSAPGGPKQRPSGAAPGGAGALVGVGSPGPLGVTLVGAAALCVDGPARGAALQLLHRRQHGSVSRRPSVASQRVPRKPRGGSERCRTRVVGRGTLYTIGQPAQFQRYIVM